MRKEIQAKLEEIVTLLNDPDEVVLDKEVKEKLGAIIELLDDPEKVSNEQEALKVEMLNIIRSVNAAMIDGDIDVEYYIPSLDEGDNMSDKPHILLTYVEDEYTTRTRKVSLATALHSTTEDFTKHVILAIEEFKDEMDDVQMG
ncbi:MAG: hypothetical protein GQ531_00210 [Sulfurovum sp.]|nr:hypothetical protein [Sulfurovum sp.]